MTPRTLKARSGTGESWSESESCLDTRPSHHHLLCEPLIIAAIRFRFLPPVGSRRRELYITGSKRSHTSDLMGGGTKDFAVRSGLKVIAHIA